MAERTWIRITAEVEECLADVVAQRLTELTGRGVEVADAQPSVRVVGYVEAHGGEDVVSSLRAFLSALPDGAGCAALQAEEVPEEDWMAVFRSQHAAVAVSPRLTVRPSWCAAGPGPEVVIDPGLAFGTGSHATTRLCLVLLDEAIGETPPPRMLDLGTGTGVLAIAAVFLGVPRSVAVDIDPTAVGVARENAARNRVADRVEILCGDVGTGAQAFPLVAANLSTPVLERDAARVAERVAPDGRLVVSGILAGEAESVLGAFRRHGLVPERTLIDGEWFAARLVRGRAGAADV